MGQNLKIRITPSSGEANLVLCSLSFGGMFSAIEREREHLSFSLNHKEMVGKWGHPSFMSAKEKHVHMHMCVCVKAFE